MTMRAHFIDPDGTGRVNITRTPDVWESYPAWSPDGRRILFHGDTDSSSALFVMNADGTWITAVTSDTNYVGKGSWSPDGSRIVFEYFPPGYRYWGPVKSEVYSVRHDGTTLTNVSRTPDTNETLGVNPWAP
jgi:Tol biopolymer transport system component